MSKCHQDVIKRAKAVESQVSLKYKVTVDRVPELEALLNDVYVVCRPKQIDYTNRNDLVRIFNQVARELFGKSIGPGKALRLPVVEEFGSFVMDMFSTWSDLDLSINFSCYETEYPRQKKIQALRKLANKFFSLRRKGHVASVQTITSAKVPIVKVVDRGTGIECDLSIENWDGIAKSKIIRLLSGIDERFRKLCLLMKSWARANGINSSKDQTLNSLSIILIVVFHLQTRDPPILPPFSDLLRDGSDPEIIMRITKGYQGFGNANKESLTELFIALFAKLVSVENLWEQGLCISVYEGAWISKTWVSNSNYISIEDFMDRSQNVARAVGKEGIRKIYHVLNHSLLQMTAFLHGTLQAAKLKLDLFKLNSNETHLPTFHDGRPEKKRKLTDTKAAPITNMYTKSNYEQPQVWNDRPPEGLIREGNSIVLQERAQISIQRKKNQIGGWGRDWQATTPGRFRNPATVPLNSENYPANTRYPFPSNGWFHYYPDILPPHYAHAITQFPPYQYQ